MRAGYVPADIFSSELADTGVQNGKELGHSYVQWFGQIVKDMSKLVSQFFSWN